MKITRRLFLTGALLRADSPPEQVDVFRSGQDGYFSYRIPSLLVTKRGALLAFCEGRKNSGHDTGDIDLLVKRSVDGGRTWGPPLVVADHGSDTVGNPCPVVDRASGAIWLALTANPGNLNEKQIIALAPGGTRTVWMTRSDDDGLTWAPAAEITSNVKDPDWSWYATGPGTGIQLRSGRLVIPCDHWRTSTAASYSHVIYSDDRGRTWKLGGSAAAKTNECQVAELSDGALLLNMRSYAGRNRRAIALSRDGGLTWLETHFDEALIEPVCQASLVRFPKKTHGRYWLLFSNPADIKRDRMTIRLSQDDGATWPVSRLLHEGPAAYSSLAVLNHREIGCLYERRNPSETIAMARFTMEWLAGKVRT
jgi:sialidase-1